LDKNGFYQPEIANYSKCTSCGLCFLVCSYSHNDLAVDKQDQTEGYAAWSNNDEIRHKCSSGGVAYELGKHFLKHGFKVCGVRYNVEQGRAEHYIADNEHDFQGSIGSKYLQSYTLNAFRLFKSEEKYFVTGTPCQIDSLRRYIKLKKIEDNYVLMDFFCHGVPSMLLWKKYIKSIGKKIGRFQRVSWRNKKFGWHNSWAICIDGENNNSNYFSLWSKGDLFFKMFLGDSCLGKACYTHCKYKGDKSSADIRVGDLWGIKYKDNDNGVNGLLVITEKGKSVITNLEYCTLVPESINVILDGQMKVSPRESICYSIVVLLIKILPLRIVFFVSSTIKRIRKFRTLI